MKSALITLAFILVFLGAVYYATRPPAQATPRESFKLDVLTIDSCQYLAFYGERSSVILHKGNCTNEVHRASH
jgi:hypothetical protein